MENYNYFIIFDRKILKDRFKILSNHHKKGSMWIDGKTCEIVMTCNSVHRYIIPFKKTNISSLFACTIEYSIYKTSLENCSSPDICITFTPNKIYFKEEEFTPKIKILNPILTNSISFSNTQHFEDEDFEIPDDIVLESNSDDSEEDLKKNFKTLKYTEGCIVITSFEDSYNIDKQNIAHKINIMDFSNDITSFIIPSKKITAYVKKLTSSKSSNISLKFTHNSYNSYVRLKAIRNENIGQSDLCVTLSDCKKQIKNEYELEIKYLASLKKLSTLSISDNNNYNKDKKIFENILFKVIEKNKIIIGLAFYPHPSLDNNKNFNASNYFSFFPLKKL
jgi:hypothetical protein